MPLPGALGPGRMLLLALAVMANGQIVAGRCRGLRLSHAQPGECARDHVEAADDYQQFEQVLHEARLRTGMRILAYCLMPNHWHLVLWPAADGTLSRFMTWLTLTHTQRWHASRSSAGAGHLYQGRYKSFLVQADEHLVSVCRYVERNPRRAAWSAARKPGAGAACGGASAAAARTCLPTGRSHARTIGVGSSIAPRRRRNSKCCARRPARATIRRRPMARRYRPPVRSRRHPASPRPPEAGKFLTPFGLCAHLLA